ncbi:MAG: B12-binding domain-containing radical SAM protein [Spirochaetaceae bacterium]
MRTILHFWNGIGVGLPALAGCTPGKHEILIVDENQEEVDFDGVYDLVGITAMTQQAPRAYEICDAFRDRGVYVALGGIHPTVMPEEAAEHADTVFVGEAENSWPEFVREFEAGRPRAVYDSAEYPDVDMKSLPVPRFDLLSRYKYPVVYVQATRGCPHDCEFCVASNVYGRHYKYKRVEQVVEEIREVKRYWKFAQIGFADDNLFVNKRYARELIAAFKEMNFSWFAVCDVSIADDEDFLRELHESGCRTVLIGFETTSEGNLRQMNESQWKLKQLSKYPESVRRIQRWGIGVYGSFILGLDEDTKGTPREIADFINKNNLLGAQITILTPFPGSRLRDRLESEGRILHDDWQWYTVWNAVIRHNNFTPKELEDGLLEVYRGIYNPISNKRRSEHFKQVCRELVSRT